jgi:hypothetical protein
MFEFNAATLEAYITFSDPPAPLVPDCSSFPVKGLKTQAMATTW